jgi:hypothetical protein
MSPGQASHALERAEEATEPALQRLWVVAAIEATLDTRLVIIGGVAVDLHTGTYCPTDVDVIGSLSKADRRQLHEAGFVEYGSRHVAWSPRSGPPVLVEFPSSTLDADYDLIELEAGVTVAVIDLRGLLIDRLLQATHPNSVSFDDAVALVAAVSDEVDWTSLATEVNARPDATYLGLSEVTAAVLVRAGLAELAALFQV